MRFKLIEKQINYNANPHDKNEGDCSIRALSLAYEMNYNSVKNELQSLSKETGGEFNTIDTIKAFIEKHGYKDYYDNEKGGAFVDDVEDFARKNNRGVYVVYCSDKTKQNTSHSFHLVTIVNGTIYDTWDSSNYYVLGAWHIKSYNRTANHIEEN